MQQSGSGIHGGFFFRAKGLLGVSFGAGLVGVSLVAGLLGFSGTALAQTQPSSLVGEYPLLFPQEQAADLLAGSPQDTGLAADSVVRPALDPRAWDQLNAMPPLLRPVAEESDLQPIRPNAGQVLDRADGLFLWLMGLVALLAVIRVQFARDVREWWRALWNRNLAHQLQRDREFALTPHGLLLFLLFVASLGTWCWLVLLRLNVSELPGLGRLTILSCVVAVMFVFFIRDALRRLTGLLFRAEEEMAFFGFEITLLQALAGGVLLPFLFVIGFAPEPVGVGGVWASLVLLVFLFGWRSLRGLQVGSGTLRHNGFAFVVYICTLEIAPIAVAVKGVSSWLSAG
jgi:hypothetical protein